MKNQYFGDVNDYHKYGLLRALQQVGNMRIAVCWMLTPNDGGKDGRRTGYLDDDANGRYDSELFAFLQEHRHDRRVAVFEQSTMLPRDTVYWSEELTDSRITRSAWFEDFWAAAAGTDLVFFDPDNGLEVPSKRKGWKGSSKYLYWDEAARAWDEGHSVLVYQHFPFEKRAAYIPKRAGQFGAACSVPEVVALRTDSTSAGAPRAPGKGRGRGGTSVGGTDHNHEAHDTQLHPVATATPGHR